MADGWARSASASCRGVAVRDSGQSAQDCDLHWFTWQLQLLPRLALAGCFALLPRHASTVTAGASSHAGAGVAARPQPGRRDERMRKGRVHAGDVRRHVADLDREGVGKAPQRSKGFTGRRQTRHWAGSHACRHKPPCTPWAVPAPAPKLLCLLPSAQLQLNFGHHSSNTEHSGSSAARLTEGQRDEPRSGNGSQRGVLVCLPPGCSIPSTLQQAPTGAPQTGSLSPPVPSSPSPSFSCPLTRVAGAEVEQGVREEAKGGGGRPRGAGRLRADRAETETGRGGACETVALVRGSGAQWAAAQAAWTEAGKEAGGRGRAGQGRAGQQQQQGGAPGWRAWLPAHSRRTQTPCGGGQ